MKTYRIISAITLLELSGITGYKAASPSRKQKGGSVFNVEENIENMSMST